MHSDRILFSDKLFSMPFSVKELVPMAQALRDACVGIIELAHPDTKPTLREDYMKAFHSVGVLQNVLSMDELQRQRDTWAYLFKVGRCCARNYRIYPCISRTHVQDAPQK